MLFVDIIIKLPEKMLSYKKKIVLKFNLRLALISLRTTGPWPLTFLIFTPLLKNVHVVFLTKFCLLCFLSLVLALSLSIHVNLDIKIKSKKRLGFVFVFFFPLKVWVSNITLTWTSIIKLNSTGCRLHSN